MKTAAIILLLLSTLKIAVAQQVNTLDPAFNSTGLVYNSAGKTKLNNCNAMAMQRDGKIILAGSCDGGAVERLNADGTLDNTFGAGGIVDSIASKYNIAAFNTVSVLPDGKIVLAGNYRLAIHNFGGTKMVPEYILVMRLNANGSADATFGDDGIGTFSFTGTNVTRTKVNAMVVQPDGKVVVGGTMYSWPVATVPGIMVRFNEDGSIDNLFGNYGLVTSEGDSGDYRGVTTAIQALQLQPGGKIIAATNAYGEIPFKLTKYNYDGTIDISFGTNVVNEDNGTYDDDNTGWARDMITLPNGEIIVSGTFEKGNDFRFVIVKYNAQDGTVDKTFGNNGIVTSLRGWCGSMALQPDGKIILAGDNFDDIPQSAYSDFYMARFNADGSSDNSFGDDGRITTYFPKDSSSSYANAIAVQADGKIVVAGELSWHVYSAMDNDLNQQFASARYSNNVNDSVYSLTTTDEPANLPPTRYLRLYPNPTTNNLNVVVNEDLSNTTLKICNMQGQVVNVTSLSFTANNPQSIDVSNLIAGIYFISIQTDDDVITQKFVKLR